MKKSHKLGWLLLGGVVLTTASLVAYENSKYKPVVLSSLEGKPWVEKCIVDYPEILWLADANVRKTEEGNANQKSSYSEQLFGKKFMEFDRTIMTLHCLRLIIDGSDKAYETFTAAQSKEARLSRESFNDLHKEISSLLQSKWGGLSQSDMIRVLETSLVLGDIGKSEKAREFFKTYHIGAPDHDDFHEELMQVLESHPELCPSFAKLPAAAKELLVKTANLAHFGHFTHLEGTPHSILGNLFMRLRAGKVDDVALRVALDSHTCDVAGALGHVNNQSSVVYTESTHQAMQTMAAAVRLLADPSKTEMDSYNYFLAKSASWLGLIPNSQSDRVIIRAGTMLRLRTPEEGAILKKAISAIPADDLNKIIKELDPEREDQLLRTPTYMPAMLVNLSNNPQLGATKEERLAKAIELGLPFLARVLEKQKEQIARGEADPNIPLNFNKAAGVAKNTPEALRGDFTIDKEGNITLSGLQK